MRNRARNGRIPRQILRGQKMLDGMTGEEIYQSDSTTRFQRDMYLHKRNYDELTTQQMEEMLMTKLAGGNISYNSGQGNESPSYTNLPTYASDAVAISHGYVTGMPYLNNAGQLVHVGIVG